MRRYQLVNAVMARYKGDPASYPPESLHDGITGSCLCGSISITITELDLFSKPNGHICHCINCRKFTGSDHSNVMMLPASNVSVSDTKGHLKVYNDTDTGSGRVSPKSFCSNCGSGVGAFNLDGPLAGFVFVGVGLFPRISEPAAELFTAHRHEWMKPIAGIYD